MATNHYLYTHGINLLCHSFLLCNLWKLDRFSSGSSLSCRLSLCYSSNFWLHFRFDFGTSFGLNPWKCEDFVFSFRCDYSVWSYLDSFDWIGSSKVKIWARIDGSSYWKSGKRVDITSSGIKRLAVNNIWVKRDKIKWNHELNAVYKKTVNW